MTGIPCGCRKLTTAAPGGGMLAAVGLKCVEFTVISQRCCDEWGLLQGITASTLASVLPSFCGGGMRGKITARLRGKCDRASGHAPVQVDR